MALPRGRFLLFPAARQRIGFGCDSISCACLGAWCAEPSRAADKGSSICALLSACDPGGVKAPTAAVPPNPIWTASTMPDPVPEENVVLSMPDDMYRHDGAPTEWWWHIGTLRAGDREFGFELNAASFTGQDFAMTQLSLTDVQEQTHYQRTQVYGPTPVGVTKVERRPITEGTDFIGRIEAVRAVDLIARINGFLREQAYEDGQEVKAGDLLFLLEKETYQAAVDAAKANLTQARANAANASASSLAS
jgi:hypothetical protein